MHMHSQDYSCEGVIYLKGQQNILKVLRTILVLVARGSKDDRIAFRALGSESPRLVACMESSDDQPFSQGVPSKPCS